MSFTTFKKNIPRGKIQLVLFNSLNNLLPPVSTLLISLLVVRLVSIELWGEYARLILLVLLLSQIAAWGNKEYLSREFSKKPQEIEPLWIEGLLSRSILLLPIFAFILLTPSTLLIKGYLAFILLFRFIAQSFDSILTYRRSYQIRILPELLHGIIFASTVILLQKQLTLEKILLLTLVVDFLKTLFIILFTQLYWKSYKFSIKIDYLKKSFVFFLLMFTSLLASRIDQVSAALFLKDSEMGKYQILMSFLLIIQASSNFVIQPFVKNIYRLKFSTLQKIALKLFLVGIPVTTLGIFLMNYVLIFFYQVNLDFLVLLSGYLFSLPIFYYSPYIFHLYKTNQVGFVIGVNIGGSVLLFVLSLIMMNMYGKGILVMLLPAGIVQCLILLAYIMHSAFKLYAVPDRTRTS